MLIVGYDTETTGLQWGDHRFIEVAALTYNERGMLLDTYIQRIHPRRSILADAQAVHGISLEQLAGMPDWEDVAGEVHRRLADADLIVAHNGAGFDLPFTNYELQRVRLPPVTTALVDTMIEGRFATPDGKYPNLGELCFACGVPYDPALAHAADYDVKVMMASYFRAREWGYFTPGKEAA